MKTLIVVNGERDWQPYFPGVEVKYRRLEESEWLLHEGRLWVFDRSGSSRVDAVLWRVGAIRPRPAHHAVLELIRMARVPCVNPAAVLLRGYDRLSMHNELLEAGLPLIPCSIALGENMLEKLQPELPAVIKVGNYHGGIGKARPADAAQWADVQDLAYATEEYITVEPYIDYVRDIRCLAIGEELWAMARRGAFWKANTNTTSHELIAVPPEIAGHTRRAMEHFGADILGLDFLETKEGRYLVLESNDIPGLAGFPEEVRHALARRMRERMEH
jgi:ribosomal protein S6--L-glutamate ligase